MKALYKTTIIIWSEEDPNERFAHSDSLVSDLGRECEVGDCYCSDAKVERVEDPTTDPAWDGTEFFNSVEEE